MATRFYFWSTSNADVSPSLAAWDRVDFFNGRGKISPTKDGSPSRQFSAATTGSVAGNTTIVNAQFVSEPMIAGVAFSTSDTIKVQVLCSESGSTGDPNVNRGPICLKVYSRDGLTLRATLKALGFYGASTTEWPNVGSPVNKTLAASVVLDAGYTTVLGDRLVFELGIQIDATGSTFPVGQEYFGSSGAGDLGENETDTSTTLNSWFEISTAIAFLPSTGLPDGRTYPSVGYGGGVPPSIPPGLKGERGRPGPALRALHRFQEARIPSGTPATVAAAAGFHGRPYYEMIGHSSV